MYKLDISHDPIKKIIHISDVHIRNLKRHVEYNEVFGRLYNYMRSIKTKNTIVVLTGDIVHAKTDITPEVVDMTHRLLSNLANIMTTVVIPGNHDANLSNASRLDALSPIVDALDHPNLIYLKNDAVLNIGGVSFVHTSVFSKIDGIIPASDIHTDGVKIALFHGPVNKVKTEHGFEIESKHVNSNSFDGYDMALLGDIHVPNQAIDDAGTKKYAGSLIMQNHSEALFKDHGILVWDVDAKKSEFVPIENDYGYATIHVENGQLVSDLTDLPKKPRLRVKAFNTSQSELQEILTTVHGQSSVEEVAVQTVGESSATSQENTTIELEDVTNIAIQDKLIKEYLTSEFGISGKKAEMILKINHETNDQISYTSGFKNVKWRPLKFEFSNMFSYGEDNVIDFSNMKGAYGIFAPNASGKSSMWDAMTYCIFDKCGRTSKTSGVLNYAKDTFDCKFTFELGGETYVIERSGKKSPKRGTVKVDVEFYRLTEEEPESLNGAERRETNSIIRDYIGSYDDFVLTAMSLQGNNSGFIEQSQRERKDLLSKFLDIDIFEALHAKANSEVKELAGTVKEYKSQNYAEKLSQHRINLDDYNSKLSDVKSVKIDREREVSETELAIDDLKSKLKPVDEKLRDTDALIKLRDGVKSKKLELQSKKSKLNSDLLEIGDKLKEIDEKIDQFNLADLEFANREYKNAETRVAELSQQLAQTQNDLKHKRSHLEGIGSLKFNDTCDECNHNKSTPFAQQSMGLTSEIEKLERDENNFEDLLQSAKEKCIEYDVRDRLRELQSLKQKKTATQLDESNLKTKISEVDREIERCDSRIEQAADIIKKSEEQKENIVFNESIEKEISDEKLKLHSKKSSLKDSIDEEIRLSGQVQSEKTAIQSIEKSIDRLKELEEKYEGYDYYLKAVKRDGIPYKMISDVLPKLEIEINNILANIVDFSVVLETDGKNINAYIDYSDGKKWDLELISGMEKFISSVAIRSALIGVSNLPKATFMAIDEGFGTLDVENFSALYSLFDYLKSQFEFIAIISHIDKTRDMVDHIIDITKTDGFSHVQYL